MILWMLLSGAILLHRSVNAYEIQVKLGTIDACLSIAAQESRLAWQRTDRYVPPDPNGFFPDDPEAGKKLAELCMAFDRNRRSDEEVLTTVRQGFRHVRQHHALILHWIGPRYVWGKEPQNPQAIEIMYHAVPLERQAAVYSGLAVVKNKTPNILRTLADLCMQGQEIARISSEIGDQRDELLAYIMPYLENDDAAKREIAAAIIKHFKGELDFGKWQRDRRLEQIKVVYGYQLPGLRETLLAGDSRDRRQALMTIQNKGLTPILDDSFLPALRAAADDPEWRVRNEVARVAWGVERQDPNAIELMLKLSTDSVRDVRSRAVYFGLSLVPDKGEAVVRRLVEMALADHGYDLYGRIVWGLKGPVKANPELFTKILAEQLDRAKSDVHHAASIYVLYREVLEAEPPTDWPLAQVREHYPPDLAVIPFTAQESFKSADADALWNAFAERLPAGSTVRRLPDVSRGASGIACFAGVRGFKQAEAIYNLIQHDSRLRVSEFYPVLSWIQLHLEEQYAPAQAPSEGQERGGAPRPAKASGEAAREPAAEPTALPLPVILPNAPGSIQHRIDAAAPGATIRLEPGVYKERLTINKPLTLEGAGWDKTIVVAEKETPKSLEETYALVTQLTATAQSQAQRDEIAAQVKKELAAELTRGVLHVENARGVLVRGVKFTMSGQHVRGLSGGTPIVNIEHSEVRLLDSAVLGGPGDGIWVVGDSNVAIEKTLIAAVWGTGVVVGDKAGSPARVHIHDSDIRNCYYAGVCIAPGNDETRIERCRISGAAWHGIRYDDISPTLVNNLIFRNARSGIYASGRTAAHVTGNLFYANEMTGMSCWFQNKDLIEGNTFAANKRAGLEVLGASKPTIRRNIFYANPTGVSTGDVGSNSPFSKSDGSVVLQDNLFWANEQDVKAQTEAGTSEARTDPHFVAPAANDFSLQTDSPARPKGIGAANPIPFEGPWPLQDEELAIIPKGDTRDSSQWQD